jgi:hypothetical protein
MAVQNRLRSVIAFALTMAFFGCDQTVFIDALKREARDSVRQHMIAPIPADLEVTPNAWGEGLIVSGADRLADAGPPVWLYLGGDDTYTLDPESERLTPGLRKLTTATTEERARAGLDQLSISDIRTYIAKSARW